MGHATHFLSRLERLAMPEVELALSLYRDVPLLRAVLEFCTVPEQAERVAIALTREEHGPHLVVTRGGDFVTCLGAAMSVGELPVISRGRLDGIAARITELRERIALAERLTGTGARTRRLLVRLAEAGDGFSREEYLGLSGFTPVMLPHYVAWLEEANEPMAVLREMVAWSTEKVDPRHPDPISRDKLLQYWRDVWMVGHISALCSEYLRELCEDLRAAGGTRLKPLSATGIYVGVVASGTRAAMLPARAGKLVLAAYKELYREARTPRMLLDCGSGLVTMALRHSPLRAEILKALPREVDATSDLFGPMTSTGPMLPKCFATLVEKPEAWVQHAVEGGREVWMKWSAGLRPNSAWRFARKEDVPESLALAAAASGTEQIELPAGLTRFLSLLPFVARARPEELYLPADCLRELRASRGESWEFERANDLVREYRTMFRKAPPARVEKRTGPNEPCPCGSGDKFKRCCGARLRSAGGSR